MTSTTSWTRGSSAAVADASAVIALIINDAAASALRTRLSGDVLLYAPAVIDLEVLNTIRRYLLHREIDAAEAEIAFQVYAGIEIMRFAHDPLFFRIWSLRGNLTAYDAAYVALAEALRVPLITLDARLAKAAPPTVRVELFA